MACVGAVEHRTFYNRAVAVSELTAPIARGEGGGRYDGREYTFECPDCGHRVVAIDAANAVYKLGVLVLFGVFGAALTAAGVSVALDAIRDGVGSNGAAGLVVLLLLFLGGGGLLLALVLRVAADELQRRVAAWRSPVVAQLPVAPLPALSPGGLQPTAHVASDGTALSTSAHVEPGERLLWRAGKAWSRYALAAACVLVAAGLQYTLGALLHAAGVSALFASFIAVPLALALVTELCTQDGVRFFLTNRRLVRVDLRGRTHVMPLWRLREVRYATVQRSDGSERVTSVLMVYADDGTGISLRAPGGARRLEELLQGFIGRYLDPEAVPSLAAGRDGGLARSDLFYARRCFVGGVEYGPLLVGPSQIARISSALSRAQQRELDELVGSHLPAAQIEARFARFYADELRIVAVSRQDERVARTARGLALPVAGDVEEVAFDAGDATRFERFAGAARAVAPHR